MRQIKITGKKNINIVLIFSIVFSFTIIMSVMATILPAMAEETASYTGLKNTREVVYFDEKNWYLIDYDESTVTLLSKECVVASESGSNNTYSGSTVETAVNNYYDYNVSSDAKTAVDGDGMFLLTTEQAKELNADVLKCSQYTGTDFNYWWLNSAGSHDMVAACVYGEDGNVEEYGTYVFKMLGVRPAIKLNLSSVTFSSDTNTFYLANEAPDANTDTSIAEVPKTGDKTDFCVIAMLMMYSAMAAIYLKITNSLSKNRRHLT